MRPAIVLSAIRIGEAALRDKHAAINSLWLQFGLAVSAERKARGISLKAFAIDLKRTSQMVCMMERGVRAWPQGLAERAVQLLKRPEQWPDAGRPPV